MSYTWEYLQRNQKQAKRLVGISYEQLIQLIEQAKLLHEQRLSEIEKNKTRLISAGGGKKSQLEEEEQIILTLIYLRHHLSFQILGLLFQVSESTANNIFNYWQSLLRESLPASLLEQAKKCEEEEEAIIEMLAEQELIVDSAEQDRERPSDYQQQKLFYSGKKKNHTFKNQFIVLPKGKDIIDVIAGKPGPKSDISLCRERLSEFDKKQLFSGDKAYLGEPQIRTPHKKPKHGELTSQQKEANKKLSSNRIFVEHVIRLIKIFKIAQERFRLEASKYESIILTVCGLVRLRIERLVFSAVKTPEYSKMNEIINLDSLAAELSTKAPDAYGAIESS
ncbi:MAG: transposase [Symploca sp. SIO1C4]|uniref:Transposase n=1 Tax=Symploca sp. SIO1C4 TaxID=2607765 RepID=A0A6B3NGQ9_9CYAN|nr:transposase [Symploca sp. SIO1C4]